jgi:hypothetical protein
MTARLHGPWPVSLLTPVGAADGAPWATSLFRGEVILDGDGAPLCWRLWTRGADSRWRPRPWDLGTSREDLDWYLGHFRARRVAA